MQREEADGYAGAVAGGESARRMHAQMIRLSIAILVAFVPVLLGLLWWRYTRAEWYPYGDLGTLLGVRIDTTIAVVNCCTPAATVLVGLLIARYWGAALGLCWAVFYAFLLPQSLLFFSGHEAETRQLLFCPILYLGFLLILRAIGRVPRLLRSRAGGP